ncbi:hypothetical protein [Massiliimalia massiliensis]|nr:hypothetical protein [Massiliimalia massiliensis]
MYDETVPPAREKAFLLGLGEYSDILMHKRGIPLYDKESRQVRDLSHRYR